MKVDRDWHSKRRAIAGIVATIFMFAMLFTVGASYFLFVNQNDLLYSQASSARASSLSSQHSEYLVLDATADPSTQVISFTAQNAGAATSNIVSFLLSDSTGSVVGFCQSGTGGSCPSLPFAVNLGATSSSVSTGFTYVSPNTYTLSVITQLGNVFTTTYPPSTTTLASQALSSGAIGDLYLQFNSYTYYAITTHSSNPSCPGSGTNSSYSNYCLVTTSGNSGPGFDIPSSVPGNIGFSVAMQNLNTQKADIILDQFTLMYQNSFYGNNHQNFVSWYIASVGKASNGYIPILQNYYLQKLAWNTPVTIYFITGGCITAGNGPTTENGNCNTASSAGFNAKLGSGQVATAFLLSNGWELTSGSYTYTQGQSNSLVFAGTGINVDYGQNSPYVTTLYE